MAETTLRAMAERYRQLLLARGNTEKHASDTFIQIMQTIEKGNIATPADFTETNIRIAIGQLKCSLGTKNHRLRSVKAFSGFLARERVLDFNPLAGMKLFNERLDPRHERRALSQAEQVALITAAETAPAMYAMSGEDRSIAWETLLRTGLRSGELRKVTGRDLQHTIGRWCLLVRASISKNGKETYQPLPPDLGQRLAKRATMRGRGRPLFDFPPPPYMVRMIRADLRRAGIPYVTGDGYADVHALRHTYLSEVTRVCDPKTAMKLARHSTIALTYNLYAHRTLPDLQAAIDQLPPLRATSITEKT